MTVHVPLALLNMHVHVMSHVHAMCQDACARGSV